MSMTALALMAAFAAVNFVECPKCDKRMRISEDGKEAFVPGRLRLADGAHAV